VADELRTVVVPLLPLEPPKRPAGGGLSSGYHTEARECVHRILLDCRSEIDRIDCKHASPDPAAMPAPGGQRWGQAGRSLAF
jgi:hypothetical protein